MPDLVIVPADVRSMPGGTTQPGKAAAAIIAGQLLYAAADGRLGLADSNAAAPANRAKGVALHAAFTDQPVTMHVSGPIDLGATLVPGEAYYLSETPGGIQPAADLGVGENVVQIGLAISDSVLDFRVTAPGVVKA